MSVSTLDRTGLHWLFVRLLPFFCLVGCQSQPVPSYRSVGAASSQIAERAKWPSTLQEAHLRLDNVLTPGQRRRIARTPYVEVDRFHRTLGTWIRNEFGLWRNGPIMKVFGDVGLIHPDDVSTIIIRTYWRSLNQQPYSMESELAEWRSEAARERQNSNKQPTRYRGPHRPTGDIIQ